MAATSADPSAPLLGAALIVRDEQAHLPACLASLAGSVDEVVVVDTGSLDSTASVAREFGATVLHHRWDDDFAAARNVALDASSAEWILYIDADERLTDHADLRAALATRAAAGAVAARVTFHAARAWTPYREHRLFRNRDDLRFESAIHETVLPAIERIVRDEDLTVIDAPATIVHLGYEGDLTRKRQRNLPLLERQVQRNPDRTYLWFDLGLTRLDLGDAPGAEAAWAAGVEAARRRSVPEPTDLLVLVQLALLRLRGGRGAHDLVHDLTDAFPDDPLTRWVESQQLMADGRWSDAGVILESLVALDADQVRHDVVAYNRALFGPWTYQALGSCRFHDGDHLAAAHWFGLAASAEPDNVEWSVKKALADARAARQGS